MTDHDLQSEEAKRAIRIMTQPPAEFPRAVDLDADGWARHRERMELHRFWRAISPDERGNFTQFKIMWRGLRMFAQPHIHNERNRP
ncbi:hypothetical protein AN189_13005 [Loktanella sp. 3ANDIMAR09]|uniref:hypothetical protein n=1 Tax=Loktanella sp. 3ANDIMAR09 TaxID=1225657 RepID=UPI0006FDCD0C|nr:hypothetical protein [Loktanella sp. 3ANDIMAR09]KQI67987.1 hypothetical protein AN189_13005 [Loktanella sp. 3ANDIMAR09]